MSSQEVNRELTDFGKKMNVIAILTLISFIAGIVGAFIYIVALVNYGIMLIIIIFFLIAIGSIKRAGRELNNQDLLGFPLKFILGTILRVIGLGFMNAGSFIIIYSPSLTTGLFAISITLILIGIALIIIGSILRLLAWSGLQSFFNVNANLFPQVIGNKARSGAKLSKIACILDMTIFLSFIGDILRIFGYFKLASLKNLVGGPAQPTYQPTYQPPAPQPTPISAPSANYCPNCGNSIASGARFCPDCGAEIS